MKNGIMKKRLFLMIFTFFLISCIPRLVNASDTYVTLYNFTFDSGDEAFEYDSESGFVDYIYYEINVTNAVHIESGSPNTNFDGEYRLKIRQPNDKWGYIEIPGDIGTYLPLNNERMLVTTSLDFDGISMYETTIFDETVLTWNTKPILGDFVKTQSVIGAKRWNVTGRQYVAFTCPGMSCDVEVYSDDALFNPQSKPYVYYKYDKYAVEDGMYTVQTNITTEIFSLTRSVSPVPILMNNGSRVTIKFNTTSTHSINVELGSSLLEIIPEGNDDFGYQKKTLYLTRPEDFTQIRVVGGLGNEEYFQLDHLKFDNCTSCIYDTTVEDLAGLKPVYLIIIIVVSVAGGGGILFFVIQLRENKKKDKMRQQKLLKACQESGNVDSISCRKYQEDYGRDD